MVSSPESSPSSSSNSTDTSSPPPPKSPPPSSPSPPPPSSPPPSTKSPGADSTVSTTSPTKSSSSSSKSKPSPAPPRRSSGSRARSGGNGDVIAGTVIGVVAFAVVLAMVLCCCRMKKKKRPPPPPMNMPFFTDEKGNVYYPNGGLPPKWQQHGSNNSILPPPGWHTHSLPHPLSGENYSSVPYGPPLPPPSPNVALGFSKSCFSYEELAAATSGFSSGNLLGQGGFGYVYKGVLAGSGKEVAVKQLKSGSGQGEREFQAEVEIISRVHHRHLVSLVGYCIAGNQRMLVYQIVPNSTLEHHHRNGELEWATRHKIALGSAEGLAYLHEDCHPRIIHRDANFLLDTNTHVSTRVMGTFGYLAPEYASSGKLTEKSDVFSFGVMLLELTTGRRPIDTSNMMEDSLVDWARPLLARALSGEEGLFEELVDERLAGDYSAVEVERMAACAAASIRHSARRRPKMSQNVRALEGDASLEDLHDSRPLSSPPPPPPPMSPATARLPSTAATTPTTTPITPPPARPRTTPSAS